VVTTSDEPEIFKVGLDSRSIRMNISRLAIGLGAGLVVPIGIRAASAEGGRTSGSLRAAGALR
jgi:hypothetical protein